MNCSPADLARASRCWQLPQDRQRAAMLMLACRWASGTGPTPPAQFDYEPPTTVITWTDGIGVHSGDLAALSALDPSSVVSIVMTGLGAAISSVSNLSSLPNLHSINLTGTFVNIIDVTGCVNLTNLSAENCDAHIIGLTTCASLESYFGTNNQFEDTLDFSGLSNLTYLDCSHGLLKHLLVSGCSSLTTINCSDNTLTSLDCTGLGSLQTLDCSNNPLQTFLGVGNPTMSADCIIGGIGTITACNLSALVSVVNLTVPACANLSNLVTASGTLNIFDGAALSGFSAPLCTNVLGGISCQNTTKVSSISLPLAVFPDAIYCNGNSALVSFLAPNVTTTADVVDFHNCPSLTTVDLTSLASTNGNLLFNGDTSLVSLTFPALGPMVGTIIDASSCPALVNVSMPIITLPPTGASVSFHGDALSTASVDNMLAVFNAGGWTSNSVDLTGGTNAQPSNCVNVLALRADGNTVIVNGPC